MMLAAIALKRKEQEDEAVRQLMREEIRRKKFKDVYIFQFIHVYTHAM